MGLSRCQYRSPLEVFTTILEHCQHCSYTAIVRVVTSSLHFANLMICFAEVYKFCLSVCLNCFYLWRCWSMSRISRIGITIRTLSTACSSWSPTAMMTQRCRSTGQCLVHHKKGTITSCWEIWSSEDVLVYALHFEFLTLLNKICVNRPQARDGQTMATGQIWPAITLTGPPAVTLKSSTKHWPPVV